MFIVFMVFQRPVRGLRVLGALRKLGSRLLKPERVLIKDLFFDAFVYLKRGLMAARIANIYLSNPRRKVKSGFGLHSDGFDGLLLGVFPTAILVCLGTDREP